MTTTLDPTTALVTATQTHHAELQTRVIELAERLLAVVEAGTPHEAARRQLVDFLRTELLPHAAAEDALLDAVAATDATALLVRAMQDQHRMFVALAEEVEQSSTGTDAAVAAGALVVLCVVRIELEDRHLIPALAEAGVDLTALLTDRTDILGDSSGTTP